jgi:hypothetical protein
LPRPDVETEAAKDRSPAGTFEPLLGGDRQREKRVAKARFEVSLS